MIESAKWVPLGADKCIIDRGAALDILDEARSMFPQELAEAERLVAARSDFIANAKHEAEAVRRAAEERSRQLVDEQEVLRMARAQSRELLVNAETRADELRRAVTEYTGEALRKTENALSSALEETRDLRTRFSRALTDSATPVPPAAGAPVDDDFMPDISEFDIDIDL
ncbi:MAG: hypothetical protein LBH17_05335 [Oscillospiraceae bacterium]|jgi:hypothetical protein|nr:hypothetical protein [Oscillospiraceae bacterium]